MPGSVPTDYAPPTLQRSRPITQPASEVDRSFYWYDLETTGTDPASDRIVQFAGVRTDHELNEVEAPLNVYVSWPVDVLPDPFACAVTRLTPQRVNRRATAELEAYLAINERFSRANTCVVGFNNLRFDDEFVRYAFYRHLIDPYAREWQHGNSRWDIIDLVRATAALRPDGIEWPMESELPTFRLEDLTAANGIAHDSAHDALSDVRATIGVARLIRLRQPRLFEYYFRLRDRAALRRRLRPENPELLLHVSRMFSRDRHCLAPIVPIARHPRHPNSVIVADLGKDVAPLVEWDTDRLRDALFGADREARPGLKEVRLNRCPFVAPISVLRERDAQRLHLDLARVRGRFEFLMSHPEISEKIAAIYGTERVFQARDVDEALYDGFLDDIDRARGRQAIAHVLQGSRADIEFVDPRLSELLFRLRARRDESMLSPDERERWHEWVRVKLIDGRGGARTLRDVREALGQIETVPDVVAELADYLDSIERTLSSNCA